MNNTQSCISVDVSCFAINCKNLEVFFSNSTNSARCLWL